MSIVNDGGTWTSTGDGIHVSPPFHGSQFWSLTGDGMYEGLALHVVLDLVEDQGEQVWGIIVPNGAKPAHPVLPAQ